MHRMKLEWSFQSFWPKQKFSKSLETQLAEALDWRANILVADFVADFDIYCTRHPMRHPSCFPFCMVRVLMKFRSPVILKAMQPLVYLAVRGWLGWIQFVERSRRAFLNSSLVLVAAGAVHCWAVVYSLFVAVHTRAMRSALSWFSFVELGFEAFWNWQRAWRHSSRF